MPSNECRHRYGIHELTRLYCKIMNRSIQIVGRNGHSGRVQCVICNGGVTNKKILRRVLKQCSKDTQHQCDCERDIRVGRA